LHYQPEFVAFERDQWAAYREMNELIADEIAKIAGPDDLIWIHDFHLFLVPQILRQKRSELKIGFFLHVPFPSSEVFRQLPVREEILSSLLEADLIGFHDYSYLRHFCETIVRLLGLETTFLAVKRGPKVTRLGVFPVSIDTEHFQRKSLEAGVRTLGRSAESGRFLFLGVDRLDYIKGVDLKFKAFASLLKRYPDCREKVSLLQIAVPTRTGAPAYARLAQEIAQLVGEINGEYSTPTWTPIQYIHSSVSNDELIALYRGADALIVTSKRDGMNLVALEYIASQDATAKPGVVLLSEFAGALSSLSATISINPWDADGTAERMHQAMNMPAHERATRIQTMQEALRRYTSTDWANNFVGDLARTSHERPRGPTLISAEDRCIETIRDRILASVAEQVVLFLDYDGTLVPIQPTPELAILGENEKRDLKELIDRYKPWLETTILSGRESGFIEEELGDLGVHLAAEHGAKHFDPLLGEWHRRIHRNRTTWYSTALKIISDYTSHVPYSRIEKKQYAITWHYRQSPAEFADYQALKLAEELEHGLANLPVSILRGKKVIEVRSVEADKGIFASAFLDSRDRRAFALGVGDDRTDEDLFLAIKGRGLSIKVGAGASAADFALSSQNEVMAFLERLLPELDGPMRMRLRNSEQPRMLADVEKATSLSDLKAHVRPSHKLRRANPILRH
jgi:trehalose 6-phosphate synthase/phosphatase